MYQKLGHGGVGISGGGRWLSAVTLLVLVGNNQTKKTHAKMHNGYPNYVGQGLRRWLETLEIADKDIALWYFE